VLWTSILWRGAWREPPKTTLQAEIRLGHLLN
jgi:hypothetical protein